MSSKSFAKSTLTTLVPIIGSEEHSGVQSIVTLKLTELFAGNSQFSSAVISQNVSNSPLSVIPSKGIPILAFSILKQDAVPVVPVHSTFVKIAVIPGALLLIFGI